MSTIDHKATRQAMTEQVAAFIAGLLVKVTVAQACKFWAGNVII